MTEPHQTRQDPDDSPQRRHEELIAVLSSIDGNLERLALACRAISFHVDELHSPDVHHDERLDYEARLDAALSKRR